VAWLDEAKREETELDRELRRVLATFEPVWMSEPRRVPAGSTAGGSFELPPAPTHGTIRVVALFERESNVAADLLERRAHQLEVKAQAALAHGEQVKAEAAEAAEHAARLATEAQQLRTAATRIRAQRAASSRS
jgi:hypothetical protein